MDDPLKPETPSLQLHTSDRPAPKRGARAAAKRSSLKPFKWLLALSILLALAWFGRLLLEEAQTSELQASELSRYAARLTYQLEAGASDSIYYPHEGPFDLRLGYGGLPTFINRLSQRHWTISEQVRFSPSLLSYAEKGLFPPYVEKRQAGLDLADCRNEPLYHFRYPVRSYQNFEAIPRKVVQSLLYIENRDLLDDSHPQINPAVDWGRFAKAAVLQVGKMAGFSVPAMGGSTLATQIEKYRHSPDGVTGSAIDKLKQMASASVRAYRDGPITLPTRQRLVLEYLDTVPLSAAPGYGEVNGLGDGLWVWFGSDFATINELLSREDGEGELLARQGQAMRQIISLMIAHRRPSWYLNNGRADLAELTDSYLRIMANAGEISPALRDAALRQQLQFRDFRQHPVAIPSATNKGVNMARTRISTMLGVPLYDLDRMDLSARVSLNGELQEAATAYLHSLANPTVAAQAGLIGPRLLKAERAKDVNYSFTLFERTAHSYQVRVQTDNTNQPFDINESSKLELGSTAKLRVMATYLEIIAELHQRYVGQERSVLVKAQANARDKLTAWALEYLLANSDHNLPLMLEAALERRYSASPAEPFFTGGGQHRFGNFRSEDNGRIPTARESLRESINLPFVRMLQEIVRYTIHLDPNGSAQVLADHGDPRRHEYLQRFADREGKVFLQRFWKKYVGKESDARVGAFLDGLRHTPDRLTAVFRYLYPDADQAALKSFLQQRLDDAVPNDSRIANLYERYQPGSFNLPDQGYIARAHPLELWLVRYLLINPEASLSDAFAASAAERQEVYKWLFKTKYKGAQDSRIRTMLEIEAFLSIHERWARLGYPFDHLVPSLATALGSSGDRPAALAELMGIIVNDGVRLPTVRIESLHFAADTPYETQMQQQLSQGEQVMQPEVAAALRGVLSEVVEGGTARRLQGIFSLDGTSLTVGGKTGTGDNRIVSVRGGVRSVGKATSRTATFVFYIGPDYFGTLTAYVGGEQAGAFSFTSALPVQVLKGMAPTLMPYLVRKPADCLSLLAGQVELQPANMPHEAAVDQEAVIEQELITQQDIVTSNI